MKVIKFIGALMGTIFTIVLIFGLIHDHGHTTPMQTNDGVQCVSTGAVQSVTNGQLQAHTKPYQRRYCGSDLRWHYVHGHVRNGHPGVWHPKKASTGGNVPNVTKNITQTVNPKSGLKTVTSGGSASGG